MAVLDVQVLEPVPPLEWWCAVYGDSQGVPGNLDGINITGVVEVGGAGQYGYRRVSYKQVNAPVVSYWPSVRCNPYTGAFTFKGVSPFLFPIEVIVHGEGIHRSVIHGPIAGP